MPLNYSAHVIDELNAWVGTIDEGAYPVDARAIRQIIGYLTIAVKFVLPNGGQLLDLDNMKEQPLDDMIRLPYPCVALEAPWVKEEEGPRVIGGLVQSRATKRIALCWNYRWDRSVVIENEYFVARDRDGVCVLSFYWAPDVGRWSIPFGGMFLPYENAIRKIDPSSLHGYANMARSAAIEAGQVTESHNGLTAVPFAVLPNCFARTAAALQNTDRVWATISLDTSDEIHTLLEVCSVLNCSNVVSMEQAASVASNKKRVGNGKQPFFSYHVLQLTSDPVRPHAPHAGGTHESPRTHLRRGHRRRLPSGRYIFVRAAVVGLGSNKGVVHKDYAVAPASSA
jgi:hypothetical protein